MTQARRKWCADDRINKKKEARNVVFERSEGATVNGGELSTRARLRIGSTPRDWLRSRQNHRTAGLWSRNQVIE